MDDNTRLLALSTIRRVLEDFPGDYSRAAREASLSRTEVMNLLNENPQIEKDLADSYLDTLTGLYKNSVIGKTVPENFKEAHALKILERERPQVWASKSDERGKAEAKARETSQTRKSLLPPKSPAPIQPGQMRAPDPELSYKIPQSLDLVISLEDELELLSTPPASTPTKVAESIEPSPSYLTPEDFNYEIEDII